MFHHEVPQKTFSSLAGLQKRECPARKENN
jgi:hypothetical protein